MKIGSIPKDEPLYEIIKARAIDLSQIKNKEERAYWRKLKKEYAIPEEYFYDFLKSRLDDPEISFESYMYDLKEQRINRTK